MSLVVVYEVFEVITLIMGLMSLLSVYFRFKESKNPLDLGIVIIIITVISVSILQFHEISTGNIELISEDMPYIGQMGVLELIVFFAGLMYGWFIFYLNLSCQGEIQAHLGRGTQSYFLSVCQKRGEGEEVISFKVGDSQCLWGWL